MKKYIDITDHEKRIGQAPAKRFRTGFGYMTKKISEIRLLEGYQVAIGKQLAKAHILLRPEEYLSIRMVCLVVGGLAGHMLTGSMVVILPGALIGWMVPAAVVKAKTGKRLKVLNDQLGDAIVLISNSLKAGYSFFQAIDAVGREMSGPIAEEFSQLLKEINLGVTTEQALDNMVKRVGSDDLDMVMTAVLIQRQVGGNLSLILDNISNTIRERVRMKGEIKTITAQGRISGLIIAVLPVGLGVILYIINPEHMKPLFTEKLGIMILVFSALMELIGIYFIRKIVKIEV